MLLQLIKAYHVKAGQMRTSPTLTQQGTIRIISALTNEHLLYLEILTLTPLVLDILIQLVFLQLLLLVTSAMITALYNDAVVTQLPKFNLLRSFNNEY